MNNTINRYTLDIIVFLLWSILLVPIALFDVGDVSRIALGLPFLFFIPGYMLISLLYPTKEEAYGIATIERVGLSIGFTITIVSITGLILNFTPGKIQLESVLLVLFFITESLGILAIYRRRTTAADKRFTVSLSLSQDHTNKKIEATLTIGVIASILIACGSILYIIVTPASGEPFTEFYLLPSNKNVSSYPQDITAGMNTRVILGLVNHEYRHMNYTIEVWLIDESVIFNESTQQNETIYKHAWFLDEIVVSLNHTEITNEKNTMNKREITYTFTINTIGYYKLAFLLFTTPSQGYDPTVDYKESIDQNIINSYREVHLWLYVG